ncbi:MAG: hypothetical protein JSW36_02160 [Burkholderiales bacterium]|nr:MAG: hypothetical protein JSW36_02160 [Burkholderiales bacterium]
MIEIGPQEREGCVTVRRRWYLAAMIGLPLITITAYLLWVWPRPHGTSVAAEVGPYLLSLATGLPFAWLLSPRRGRAWLLLAFLAGGFVVLWIYAVAVLCGVRGVCL